MIKIPQGKDIKESVVTNNSINRYEIIGFEIIMIPMSYVNEKLGDKYATMTGRSKGIYHTVSPSPVL
jgi:hypothetical protein